jgi:hypothetical protein
MAGGEIQIMSVGKQDKLLMGKPQITFFKTVYKRHVNFAIETKTQQFYGGVDYGKKNECLISKDGDLISGLSLYIELGSLNESIQNSTSCSDTEDVVFSWVNSIGHALIDAVEIQFDGITIDRQYGEWYEIWNELSQPEGKKSGYDRLIGKKSNAGFSCRSFTGKLELIVPLQFWFCKKYGLALPILAMIDQEIRLKVRWKKLDQLWITNKFGNKPSISPSFRVTLMIDFVLLDVAEKLNFLSKRHIYMIEQIQSNGGSMFRKGNMKPKVKLNFYHPIKELIWVFQRADTLTASESHCGNDWFNFTNVLDYSAPDDFFNTGRLLLDRSERFKCMPAIYFRLYHPWKYHTKSPNNFIYCYSFALKPEEQQPTGSCNFSNFQSKILELTIEKPIESDYFISVYGINYNPLIIHDGQAFIVFTH